MAQTKMARTREPELHVLTQLEPLQVVVVGERDTEFYETDLTVAFYLAYHAGIRLPSLSELDGDGDPELYAQDLQEIEDDYYGPLLC